MTVLSMPKNKEVTVRQKEFPSFLQHVIRTIEDHLQYTEQDAVTETVWNDFKCNGIIDDSLHNIESIAHLLQITDPADMTLGNVIVQLFESLKVLRHYYAITKVNEKSVKIRCIVINDMKRFFNDLNNDVVTKQPSVSTANAKQTVLTDVFKPAALDKEVVQLPSDEEDERKIQATSTSDDDNKVITESKSVPTSTEATIEYDKAGPATVQVDHDDGFVEPKKTVKHVQPTSTTTTANVGTLHAILTLFRH